MSAVKAYEEIIDFIAVGTTPKNVIAFRPSEAAQERVADLLSREKEGQLSHEEKSELDCYLQLEHLMRQNGQRAYGHSATDARPLRQSAAAGNSAHQSLDDGSRPYAYSLCRSNPSCPDVTSYRSRP